MPLNEIIINCNTLDNNMENDIIEVNLQNMKNSLRKRSFTPSFRTDALEDGRRLSTINDEKTSIYWKYGCIFLAEFMGTTILMCLGCMSCVGNSNPVITAFGFGLVVASLIQMFGHISAAHFNPAVTLCFYIYEHISLPLAMWYVLAEITGCIAGFTLLKYVVSADLDHEDLCCTLVKTAHPALGVVVEFMATSCLILTVCSVIDPVNANKQDSAPIKFGFVIAAMSLTAGNLTGASMNPARSLAPALIQGIWENHWVFWVGPILAGFIMPIFYRLIFLDRFK